MLNQLQCNGVLEGIRICRKGFPNRMLHNDVKFRYAILSVTASKSSPDDKKCAEALMAEVVKRGELTPEEFRVGATKVFFRAGILAKMEDLRDQTLAAIMKGLQACVRWFCELVGDWPTAVSIVFTVDVCRRRPKRVVRRWRRRPCSRATFACGPCCAHGNGSFCWARRKCWRTRPK